MFGIFTKKLYAAYQILLAFRYSDSCWLVIVKAHVMNETLPMQNVCTGISLHCSLLQFYFSSSLSPALVQGAACWWDRNAMLWKDVLCNAMQRSAMQRREVEEWRDQKLPTLFCCYRPDIPTFSIQPDIPTFSIPCTHTIKMSKKGTIQRPTVKNGTCEWAWKNWNAHFIYWTTARREIWDWWGAEGTAVHWCKGRREKDIGWKGGSSLAQTKVAKLTFYNSVREKKKKQ